MQHVKLIPSLDVANVRVEQEGRKISIQIGGLSFLQSMGARMHIEVLVSLPRHCEHVSIDSYVLPLIAQSIDKAGDLVFKTSSAPITVAAIDAKSLTVESSSGSVTFEQNTRQMTDKFINVQTSSSAVSLLSTRLQSPEVQVKSNSGSVKITDAATNARTFKLSNRSASINASLDFTDLDDREDDSYTAHVENSSGSIQMRMKHWSGFVTARAKSGSVKVRGSDIEQVNGGWQKGSGSAKASFLNSSGSIAIDLD